MDKIEPIHAWFGLTYAQYLTIPRTVLQSMPNEWQQRFVKCLEEMNNTIDWKPEEGTYYCYLRKPNGRFTKDPLADYERGRRQLPLKVLTK